MAQFTQGAEVVRLKCDHVFHCACVEKWLSDADAEANVECPICRAPVVWKSAYQHPGASTPEELRNPAVSFQTPSSGSGSWPQAPPPVYPRSPPTRVPRAPRDSHTIFMVNDSQEPPSPALSSCSDPSWTSDRMEYEAEYSYEDFEVWRSKKHPDHIPVPEFLH